MLHLSVIKQFILVANGYWRRHPHPLPPSLLTSYISARNLLYCKLSSLAIALICLTPSFTPASHRYTSPLTFIIPFELLFFPLYQSYVLWALVPSFLSCYRSPCTAPPLLFADPLHIPPTMLPSPFTLLILFSLPSSFPPSFLLGHFLPLLSVTPYELFTCATRWGDFCCVSWPFTAQRQKSSVSLKARVFPLNVQVSISDLVDHWAFLPG